MPELKPVPAGWMTEGGRKLDGRANPLERLSLVQGAHNWRAGQAFTVDGHGTPVPDP
ncbi:MAG TPA: hypothetical protein VFB28_13310 [Terriglobales bacterium]|nr:hypothetical protein [Terriglobales bacterium]